MARFRRTTAPEALPGCCFICRGTSREFFIDIDVDIQYPERSPFDGAAYLCSECLRELAQMAGYKVPEQVDQDKELINTLETLNFQLLTRVDGLEKAVDGLRTARDAGGIDSVWGNTVSSPSNDEGTSEGEAEVGGRKGSPSESVNDEGMGFVPTDADSTKAGFNF